MIQDTHNSILIWSKKVGLVILCLSSIVRCDEVELCGSVDLSPDCQPATFLSQFVGADSYASHIYITTEGVQGFTVNQENGALTALSGNPFGSGCAQSITISPEQNYLYYSTNGSNLNVMGVSSPDSPTSSSLAFNPINYSRPTTTSENGKHFFYVSSSGSEIGVLDYNSSDGSLSSVSGSPFGTGCYSSLQQIGSFIFAGEIQPAAGASRYITFSYDSTTGNLSQVASTSTEYKISYQVKHPRLDIIYASNGLSSTTAIHAFNINASDGSYTIHDYSFAASNKSQKNSAIMPDGSYLYLYNSIDNTIVAFAIDSAGMLTYVATHDFTIGSSIRDMKIDPSGKYMYLTVNALFEIWVLSIASDGKLTKIDASTQSTGGNTPTGIEIYTQTIPW